jgi:DHA1 family multidrug resistance protein B-like MFS transporter
MLTTNSIYFIILLIVIASLGSLATQSSSLIASLTLMISQYLNIYLIFIILTLLSITAILMLYKIYNKRMESV